MRTAVDTNVLLDLLLGETERATSARQALVRALEEGPVSVCPVVYAELGAAFAGKEESLGEFLSDLQIRLDGFAADALLYAATAWRSYTRRRGKAVQCPNCGTKTEVVCPACSAQISWRQHIMTDFLVGGHALFQADRILTRDPRYYRSYFEPLKVVTPANLVP